MTGAAIVDFDFEGMRVMAINTGIVSFHMVKLGVVGLAVVLVATLGHCAKLRGRGCIVMDIGKPRSLH